MVESAVPLIREGVLNKRRYLTIIFGFILGGVFLFPLYAIQAGTLNGFLSITAVGLAIAGASLILGGLLGLLFGIPRRLQRDEATSTAAAASESAIERSAVYGANTNLEQISDWLTKILVGVGLVQIGNLGSALHGIGVSLAPGIGGFTSSVAFSIVTSLYFFLGGFLVGYLWTRLYLGQALTIADQALLEEKISEFEKRVRADARALQLSAQQLDPSQPEVDLANLSQTLTGASYDTLVQIFYKAQYQRRRNWREDVTKPTMERTISIFKSLIEKDSKKEFHQNYGELGYALKESIQPKWQEAIDAFSQAISIRGERDPHFRMYEFNRAVCKIMTEDAIGLNEASSEEIRSEVQSDLKIAAAEPRILEIIRQDKIIQSWLRLNSLELDDII